MKLFLILMLLLVSTPVAHATDCPLNYVSCNIHQFSSNAPTYSVFCPIEPGQAGQSSASYDLTNGVLETFTSGRDTWGGASIIAYDVYELVGPEEACTHTFKVNLHVVAEYTRARFGAEGDLDVFVNDIYGFGPKMSKTFHVTTATDTVLSMSLSACPGFPIQLLHYL